MLNTRIGNKTKYEIERASILVAHNIKFDKKIVATISGIKKKEYLKKFGIHGVKELPKF